MKAMVGKVGNVVGNAVLSKFTNSRPERDSKIKWSLVSTTSLKLRKMRNEKKL